MSAFEEIKKLDQQRRKLLEGAKKEALDKVNAAIEELNSLGFNYELREKGTRQTGSARTGTRTVKDEACPICGIKTVPPHDRRAHRVQGENKKPFTDEELQARGYQKAA